MIPIVAILSSVSALLSFFISYRLWRRSRVLKSLVMQQFAYCYFFFGLFFFFFVPAGILHTNEVLIALDAAIAYFALFIAIAFFIEIPLEIFKQFFWAEVIFWATVITGGILLIGNIIYLKEALKITQGPFVYYLIQGQPLVQLLNTIIPTVFDIVGIIFFISQGYYLSRQAKFKQDQRSAPVQRLSF